MLGTTNRKVCREPLTHNEFILIQAIGAEVCTKIKEIFPDKTWTQVSSLFTLVKERMRNFYSNLNEIEMHKELRKYIGKDIKEILDDK